MRTLLKEDFYRLDALLSPNQQCQKHWMFNRSTVILYVLAKDLHNNSYSRFLSAMHRVSLVVFECSSDIRSGKWLKLDFVALRDSFGAVVFFYYKTFSDHTLIFYSWNISIFVCDQLQLIIASNCLMVMVWMLDDVQVIDWKDSSPKWPIMCWWGRTLNITHSLTHCRWIAAYERISDLLHRSYLSLWTTFIFSDSLLLTAKPKHRLKLIGRALFLLKNRFLALVLPNLNRSG